MSSEGFNLSESSAEVIYDKITAMVNADLLEFGEDHWYSPTLLPTFEQFRSLLNICFWASLLKEENHPISFLLYFDHKDSDRTDNVFKNSIPLNSEAIKKLAPAFEGSCSFVICSNSQENLIIDGFSQYVLDRKRFGYKLTVSSLKPGQLIVSLHWEPVAFLTGSRVVLIDNKSLDFQSEMASVVIRNSPPFRSELVSWVFIKDLARRMFLLQRGGTLIITDNKNWKQSVTFPIVFDLGKVDRLLRSPPIHQGATIPLNEITLRDYIGPTDEQKLDILARFTTVDGAVVTGTNLEPLAIGSKLKPMPSNVPPEDILVVEPIEGHQPTIEPFSSLGGTRHQSAALFVNDHRDSLAIVASVDNKISFVRWDEAKDMLVVLRHAEIALFG
jgi:hypothetical protein